MTTMNLILPWPPNSCSPNARKHWTTVAAAKRRLRRDWYIVARSQGAGAITCKTLSVSIEFAPPDRRRRDVDNLLASCKAGIDGLSDLFGVDDSKWLLSISRAPEPVKGGSVRVTVEDATSEN